MRMIRLIGAFLVIGVMSVSASAAHAQTGAQTFTLQPGGKATVQFEAFCVVFGKKFPAAINGPSTQASDPVRAGFSYIRTQELAKDEQKALQAQYAIWQLLNQGGPQGDATTQDVIANATNPPVAPQGTSVLDAASANQVKVTIDSWNPVGQPVQVSPGATDNFYGRGQLTIENTSRQALTMYMPIGTVFPAANPDEQSVAGYATNVQVTNPDLPETSQGVLQSLLPLATVLLLGLAFGVRLVRKTRA